MDLVRPSRIKRYQISYKKRILIIIKTEKYIIIKSEIQSYRVIVGTNVK